MRNAGEKSLAPALVEELRILPFGEEDGKHDAFLVETPTVSFLVNDRVKCLLEALRGQPSLPQLAARLSSFLHEEIGETEVELAVTKLPPAIFQNSQPSSRGSPFHFSFSLLASAKVKLISHPLRFLYAPPVVILVGAALVIELPGLIQGFIAGSNLRFGPEQILALLGIGLVSALAHELGHAVACAWYGVTPGAIGCGLYLLFPAFYTDATAAWKLPGKNRAVIDLGGIYFQFVLLVLLVPMRGALLPAPWIDLLIVYNLCLAAHNLNPIFKRDGYWLISDVAGLPNLHRRVWETLRLRSRRTGALSSSIDARLRLKRYVLPLYVAAFLVYVAFLIASLPRWAATHLWPYPQLATERWAAMSTAWTQANWATWSYESVRLVSASLVPLLLVVWFGAWIGQAMRRINVLTTK